MLTYNECIRSSCYFKYIKDIIIINFHLLWILLSYYQLLSDWPVKQWVEVLLFASSPLNILSYIRVLVYVFNPYVYISIKFLLCFCMHVSSFYQIKLSFTVVQWPHKKSSNTISKTSKIKLRNEIMRWKYIDASL